MLNGAKTSATLSPASPSSGQQFNVTNYQITVNLPNQLASAAQSLGNPSITGTAQSQLDVTGATPATMSTGTLNIDVPLPATIPPDGLSMDIPATPISLGPFTAGASGITVQQDSGSNLTLVVSGTNLALQCTSYPDNSNPTGILPQGTNPSGSPIAPVIALANGGTTTTTAPTTTAPKSTTTTSGGGGGGGGGGGATPVTASSSNLAFTGTGGGTKLMALAGAALVLFGLVLLGVVDAPKRMLAFVQPGHVRSRVKTGWPRFKLPDGHVFQRVSETISERFSKRAPTGQPVQPVHQSTPVDAFPRMPAPQAPMVRPDPWIAPPVGRSRPSGASGSTRSLWRSAQWLLGRD